MLSENTQQSTVMQSATTVIDLFSPVDSSCAFLGIFSSQFLNLSVKEQQQQPRCCQQFPGRGLSKLLDVRECKKEIDKCVFLEKNDHNRDWELRRGYWDTTTTATICISVCDCTSGSSLQHCGTCVNY